MIYSEFKGKKLSALGLGCMRLPVIGGDDSRVDEAAVFEMVDYALAHGINYFDTAWGYHGGNSETAIGKALNRHPRDSFFIADKFPGYDVSNFKKVKEIFEEQLKKCGVEYFDFYLFHTVAESNIDGYLNPEFGVFEFLSEQKRNGKIRHLGFSAHGGMHVLNRFLDKYGKEMEFGQLQINWLDWTFQNAKEKVELFKKFGIPVWVMEPVRGGKLAMLSDAAFEKLQKLRPEASRAEWAFRFLQSIPEVKVTLSGMSNFEQLKENIAVYEEKKPLDERETGTLLEMAAGLKDAYKVPCTMCRYCMSYCPQGINIPNTLEAYNQQALRLSGAQSTFAAGADSDNRPTKCISCKSCEAVCPQQIKITEFFADFNAMLTN